MKYGKSKVLICEIMGFVRIFKKSYIQEAYLQKTSISAENNCLCDSSPVML